MGLFRSPSEWLFSCLRALFYDYSWVYSLIESYRPLVSYSTSAPWDKALFLDRMYCTSCKRFHKFYIKVTFRSPPFLSFTELVCLTFILLKNYYFSLMNFSFPLPIFLLISFHLTLSSSWCEPSTIFKTLSFYLKGRYCTLFSFNLSTLKRWFLRANV